MESLTMQCVEEFAPSHVGGTYVYEFESTEAWVTDRQGQTLKVVTTRPGPWRKGRQYALTLADIQQDGQSARIVVASVVCGRVGLLSGSSTASAAESTGEVMLGEPRGNYVSLQIPVEAAQKFKVGKSYRLAISEEE